MSRHLTILLAGPALAVLLLLARATPLTGFTAAVIVLAGLSGGYAKSRAARAALVAAALEPGTRLARLLTGRLTAAVTATTATLATAGATTYAAMTGAGAEVALLMGAVLATAISVSLLDVVMAGRIVPGLRASVAEPVVLILIGIPFALLHMWIGYARLPTPDWLDPVSLSGTLSGALAALPSLPPILAEMCDAMRLADATIQWFVAQPGGTTPLTVILMLAKGAAFMFSATKLAADACAAAILPPGVRP